VVGGKVLTKRAGVSSALEGFLRALAKETLRDVFVVPKIKIDNYRSSRGGLG